jgi:NADH-quinone oxidoreductase subunit L
MPTTYWTFLVATVAIAGIPPLAGFVSKDAILAKVFEAGYTDLNHFGNVYYLLWVLGLGGAALTAFYMFRLVFMTFSGDFRGGEEAEHHLHESPWTMTLPLQVLAVLSIFGGLIIGFPGILFHAEHLNFIDGFMGPGILGAGGHGGEHAGGHAVSLGLEWALVVLSVCVAAAGILLAYRWYKADPEFSKPKALAGRFPFAHRLLLNKYWVDELYDATIIRPCIKLADLLWEFDARVVDGVVNGMRHTTVGSSWFSGIFDLQVVDGLVNLVGRTYDVASRQFRRLQVGFTQGYAMVMVFGAAVLLGIFFVVNL